VFHPEVAEYIFFSAAQKTLLKKAHISGYKASHSKYKKTEVTPCIISDNNGKKSRTQ
jgi:hypothetical protein